MAAQYGLDSNVEDVAATLRTLGRVHSPAILVGHSYGGTVITAAGTDDRVAGLVYICALGPDETETSQGQQDKYPKTPVFSQIDVADGRVWLKPSGIGCFGGDLHRGQQRPDRPLGPRAGLGQADGRHDLRHRQQPRPHAVPPRLRPRRHPHRRKRNLSQRGYHALDDDWASSFRDSGRHWLRC